MRGDETGLMDRGFGLELLIISSEAPRSSPATRRLLADGLPGKPRIDSPPIG